MKILPLLLSLSGLLISSFNLSASEPNETLQARKASDPPIIDGKANDPVWQQAKWHPLNHHILGEMPTPDDFQGRFKISWDNNRLYILAEITDDILFDQHADPLLNYWDDDCLEIFIDEDKSGGNHQFNFNAFAYHIALDQQVVDIGPNLPDGKTQFILLNEHIDSAMARSTEKPYSLLWEVSMAVYADDFKLNYAADEKPSQPVTLTAGKHIGFMMAYCDNDGSPEREHFLGSKKITPVNGDKNLGYINADVFGDLLLVE